jgi:hypothetical protein
MSTALAIPLPDEQPRCRVNGCVRLPEDGDVLCLLHEAASQVAPLNEKSLRD